MHGCMHACMHTLCHSLTIPPWCRRMFICDPHTTAHCHDRDNERAAAMHACAGDAYDDLACASLLGQAPSSHVGLWPGFTLLNHSCMPNCVHYIAAGHLMVVRASQVGQRGPPAGPAIHQHDTDTVLTCCTAWYLHTVTVELSYCELSMD